MELLDDSIITEETNMNIIHMRNALDELSKLKERPPEYSLIYDSMIAYLNKWCVHSMTTDDIDVDYGERSIRICFCEKCFLHEEQLTRTNLSVTTNCVSTTTR